jgi:hypothetical protein
VYQLCVIHSTSQPELGGLTITHRLIIIRSFRCLPPLQYSPRGICLEFVGTAPQHHSTMEQWGWGVGGGPSWPCATSVRRGRTRVHSPHRRAWFLGREPGSVKWWRKALLGRRNHLQHAVISAQFINFHPLLRNCGAANTTIKEKAKLITPKGCSRKQASQTLVAVPSDSTSRL